MRLDYAGMVGFDTSAKRTITSGAVLPFAPLRGAGRKTIRTVFYYNKWGLRESWTVCAPRIGCYRVHKKWTEIRPEQINGGDESVTSRRRPPAPPREVWCGGRIRKGYGNTIVRGQADITSAGVHVFGIDLSTQSGFDSTVRVKFDARRSGEPIMVCGYSGAALSDPGSAVAVDYK